MKQLIISIIVACSMTFNMNVGTTNTNHNHSIDTVYVNNTVDVLYSIPIRQYLEDYSSNSRGFGTKFHPVFKKMMLHTGIDIPCKIGTKICTDANGRVVKSGWNNGYGFTIDVSHGLDSNGNDIKVRYAHLSSIFVKVGEFIKKGDIIGNTGNTGISTAPHLHYEYHINGKPVNPLNYITFEKPTNTVCNESKPTYSMQECEYGAFYQLSDDEIITNCKFLQYQSY